MQEGLLSADTELRGVAASPHEQSLEVPAQLKPQLGPEPEPEPEPEAADDFEEVFGDVVGTGRQSRAYRHVVGCIVLALAIFCQLALTWKILEVQTDAAANAGDDDAVPGVGLARAYCVISDNRDTKVAHGVNDALQQGCTLIGGLAVGEGYVHRANHSEPMFAQALMCDTGKGCAGDTAA